MSLKCLSEDYKMIEYDGIHFLNLVSLRDSENKAMIMNTCCNKLIYNIIP